MDSQFLNWQRLVQWVWVPLLRGSSLSLFVGLPFAYFYQEANGLFHTRRTVKRFLAACVEVGLFGVLVLGIARLLQVSACHSCVVQ